MSVTLWIVLGVAVVAVVFLWEKWERHRGVDEDFAARQGDHGWRLVLWIVGAVLLLAAGLALEGFGVPGGAVAAIVAVAGLLLLVNVAPWLGPRRRR